MTRAILLLAALGFAIGCQKTATKSSAAQTDAADATTPNAATTVGPHSSEAIGGSLNALVDQDRAVLQKGPWNTASIDVDNTTGRYIVPDRLVFQPDGTLTDAADGKLIGAYTIDPTKTPKEIDLTTYDESRKGTYLIRSYPRYTELHLCMGKTVDSPRPKFDGDELRAERAKVVDSGGKLQLGAEFNESLEVELVWYLNPPPTSAP